jgi:hypothetical protein
MGVRVALSCFPYYKEKPDLCPLHLTYDLKCLKLLWPEKVGKAAQQLLVISEKKHFT